MGATFSNKGRRRVVAFWIFCWTVWAFAPNPSLAAEDVYVSGAGERIIVDLNSPRLQAWITAGRTSVEKQMAQGIRAPQALMNVLIDLSRASGIDNADERSALIAQRGGTIALEKLLNRGLGKCRELGILGHLILRSMGIENSELIVVQTYNGRHVLIRWMEEILDTTGAFSKTPMTKAIFESFYSPIVRTWRSTAAIARGALNGRFLGFAGNAYTLGSAMAANPVEAHRRREEIFNMAFRLPPVVRQGFLLMNFMELEILKDGERRYRAMY